VLSAALAARSRRSACAGAIALALLPATASAFNPQARPAPSAGAPLVCADDPASACSSDTADGCASGTCVVDRAALVPGLAVRGTLTLITDEDVTGWDEGADASEARKANARFTLLLQYERAGAPRTFAETYVLSPDDCGGAGGGGGGGGGGGTGGGGGSGANPDGLHLCVPSGIGWNQPAGEAFITDPQLNIPYSVPGAAVAKAIAVDLTGDPATTARPFLDVVDLLPETTSAHPADPLASVQQLKVTIRLIP
jgi:hypothetical protein